jgi:hypothetical protein
MQIIIFNRLAACCRVWTASRLVAGPCQSGIPGWRFFPQLGQMLQLAAGGTLPLTWPGSIPSSPAAPQRIWFTVRRAATKLEIGCNLLSRNG